MSKEAVVHLVNPHGHVCQVPQSLANQRLFAEPEKKGVDPNGKPVLQRGYRLATADEVKAFDELNRSENMRLIAEDVAIKQAHAPVVVIREVEKPAAPKGK